MTPNYAFVTIAEGSYLSGVVALVNSAIKCGFAGKFYVYYKGSLPSWCSSLKEVSPSIYEVGSSQLIFRQSSFPYHLRFSKPNCMLEILAEDETLDGVFYADPDVVLLAPWTFFESWIDQGVTLCLDSNFPWIHERHPWRVHWEGLISAANLTVASRRREYGNSGFVGVSRSQAKLLENWKSVVEAYEKSGADVITFKKVSRITAVAGDQDLLMAALMTIEEDPSFIGMEGMGFNNYFLILSHAIDRIKPWDRKFALSALKGDKASETNLHWLQNARHPIEGISESQWRKKMLDYKVSLAISRIWRR